MHEKDLKMLFELMNHRTSWKTVREIHEFFPMEKEYNLCRRMGRLTDAGLLQRRSRTRKYNQHEFLITQKGKEFLQDYFQQAQKFYNRYLAMVSEGNVQEIGRK